MAKRSSTGRSRSRTCSARSAKPWASTRGSRTRATSAARCRSSRAAGPWRKSFSHRATEAQRRTLERESMRCRELIFGSGLLCASVSLWLTSAFAAEVESRQLTHYVPQDALEAAVRKEGWTEIPLAVKGGVRKGDVVRVWTGGTIDRGGAGQPGENVNGPEGVAVAGKATFALSPDPAHAYALLFKSEGAAPAAG